jgi:ATP-dependent Clp protease ATP-binding subunit ClpC
VQIQVRDLSKRLEAQSLTLELTAEAKEFLTDKGFDPAYGARPLRRAIQKYLEDPIAEELLKGAFLPGTRILVKVNTETGELHFAGAASEKETGNLPAENSAGVDGAPATPPGGDPEADTKA